MVNRSPIPDESSPKRGEPTPDGFRTCESGPIPPSTMDGNGTFRTRALLAALALVAAGGSIGAVHAAGAAETAAVQAEDPLAPAADLPRFVPTAEPIEAESTALPEAAPEWV